MGFSENGNDLNGVAPAHEIVVVDIPELRVVLITGNGINPKITFEKFGDGASPTLSVTPMPDGTQRLDTFKYGDNVGSITYNNDGFIALCVTRFGRRDNLTGVASAIATKNFYSGSYYIDGEFKNRRIFNYMTDQEILTFTE